MRIISINEAVPGMVVGRTLYAPNGSVLLSAGIELTPVYIDRLYELGVMALYVRDENLQDVEVGDVISEKTRVEAIKITKEAMKHLKVNQSYDMKKIYHAVNSLIDELIRNRNILINLIDIRAKNEYIFAHSVNVTVLSVMIGIAMEYNQLKLKDLAAGAILHDIGKALFDQQILHKEEALNSQERESMKQHTALGFEILRKVSNYNLLSAHVALQHHEYYDGKGYPRAMAGEDIVEFARIVSVANVYDKMTTDRDGHRRLPPSQAIEVILTGRGTWFDPDIVDHFTKIIAVYPIGSEVMLNSGEKGVVAATHKDNPTRPTVRIIEDYVGEKLDQIKEVNLMLSPDYHIVALN